MTRVRRDHYSFTASFHFRFLAAATRCAAGAASAGRLRVWVGASQRLKEDRVC